MDRRRDGRSADSERGREKGGIVDSRPSVFSRLGNKIPGQGGAARGSSAGGTTRNSGAGWPDGRQSLSPKRKEPELRKGKPERPRGLKGLKDSPLLEENFEDWSSKDLDDDDQSTLEKKRELLQRELARQLEEDRSKLKRLRSSSSSSSSSTSGSSSSSSSSSESNKGKKKDGKKIKKKLKRDSSVSSLDKTKLKKLKLKLEAKKMKKGDKGKKKVGVKTKKLKVLKEKKEKKDEKDSSKKVEPKPAEVAPRINLIKPGVQERDKFGFYIAAPQPQVVKSVESSPERRRSRTPQKRKKSQDKPDRKKDLKRDSPKISVSKDRKGRDNSKSPARKSPVRKRSPISKKSPYKSNRDRSPLDRGRSPAGRDKRGGSRDRRDLTSDRGRDRQGGRGGHRKDDRKDEDLRKDLVRRDDDKKHDLVDRRKEDRGSHGSDDRNRTNQRGERDDRGKRDERRYDFDEDRRRRDERPNIDRKKDDLLLDKKRDEDKGRGRENDWKDVDKRGGGNGRKNQERGKLTDRNLGRFDRRRDWEGEEKRLERKRDDEGDARDFDSRRPNWNRGDSPRRGRGRGKRGRAERRMDFDRGEEGWKKGRHAAQGRKRNLSGKKEDLKPKSRQTSLDKSLDIKSESPKDKSPETNSTEEEKEKTEGEEKIENSESKETEKDELEKGENAEGLVEDFSDFGESDEEILNQEDEKGLSRPDSSNSNKSDKQSRVLEDGSDVLENLETLNKSDCIKKKEIEKANATIADALGVDWSLLVKDEKLTEKKKVEQEAGVARKNWSAPEIIRRTGLSKRFLGEEVFNRILDSLNKNLPADQKVELLDPVPGFHRAKVAAREEERRIFAPSSQNSRALSARGDLLMRRRLNGLRYPEFTVLPELPIPRVLPEPPVLPVVDTRLELNTTPPVIDSNSSVVSDTVDR